MNFIFCQANSQAKSEIHPDPIACLPIGHSDRKKIPRMDALRQDIRHGLRRLARSPGFTIVALLTLALGIGANTAIFTVVNAIILKPLPYDHPEQLVGVFHRMRGTSDLSTLSPPNFIDVRTQTRALADVAAVNTSSFTITGTGTPVRVDGAQVSASLFDVLRVSPILGRRFHAEENEPGKHHVVVLSHALWLQRFGGNRDVVGRTITIDSAPHTVVGVMPAGFSYPEGRALWVPFEYRRVVSRFQSRGVVSGRDSPAEAGRHSD